ncbi:hypothetical protein BCR35DRAFT_354925 [Leucosporidium creatinivorum]|uniref:F-box domain-containing protein n=1 Tax=Leucosporidium creatinivorum TaxID=106004 RepID=A0A1Y2DZK9_9BASI|nr:hypothetical protein BCR35DRAFT_354925 [Leucosporidium creatinivorum]
MALPTYDAVHLAKRRFAVPSSPRVISEEQAAPTVRQLPLELILEIIYCLDGSEDLFMLAQSCRAFYRPATFRRLLLAFADRAGFASTLYALRGAQSKELGYLPFSILHAYHSTELSTVVLEVAECADPRELRENEPTRSYQQVQWSSEVIQLEVYAPTVEGSAWGRLVRVTSDLMNERFTCPECFDDRRVEWGSEQFSARWPELSLPPPQPLIDIDCPRCTITAHDAFHQVLDVLERREFSPTPYPALSIFDDQLTEDWQTIEELEMHVDDWGAPLDACEEAADNRRMLEEHERWDSRSRGLPMAEDGEGSSDSGSKGSLGVDWRASASRTSQE